MSHELKNSFIAAFPRTIPILTGYLFLGGGFGLLLTSAGYPWYWTTIMAIVIYAGMGQYVAVNMLAPGVSLIDVFLVQATINARHSFYGITMLQKYNGMGKLKPYLIFTMTDETFSLLCSAKIPEGVSEKQYFFFVSLLDHLYWICGCTLGGVIGSLLKFDTTGIEMIMTSLFLTIAIDQWKDNKDHLPVFIGGIAAVVCLVIFGAEHFIIPALILLTAGLLLFRKRIEAATTREALCEPEEREEE